MAITSMGLAASFCFEMQSFWAGDSSTIDLAQSGTSRPISKSA